MTVQIHAFNYIDGLSGEVGDLLLLPGSHKRCAGQVASVPRGPWPANRRTLNRVYARSAFGALFGSSHLPGAISFDNLPPGTTILAHSACLHGRRPRPGPGPRYFVSQGCNYRSLSLELVISCVWLCRFADRLQLLRARRGWTRCPAAPMVLLSQLGRPHPPRARPK